jgi:hypothetical protein
VIGLVLGHLVVGGDVEVISVVEKLGDRDSAIVEIAKLTAPNRRVEPVGVKPIPDPLAAKVTANVVVDSHRREK